MSEQGTSAQGTSQGSTVLTTGTGKEQARGHAGGFLAGPVGRNLGLVLALVILCVVGIATAGDRFADVDNVLTILRLASVIGVVSVGMTFVIIGGGIDLSVGALVALASVWATTLATQQMAEDVHWIVMVFTALVVGGVAGLVNGVVIAYGRLAAFIATLAMLAAARGLAEIIANRRTQIVRDRDFLSFFSGDVLGVPTLVIIFALVAVAGWVLLNRTTFGRRTFAVGGNAEAARLAGIRVQRHTVKLYVLSGICCGIAAVMLMARTTTGSSTHGTLYELDAIAAVVIGGTLLIGGRGTIVGTVLGVLIFTTLGNVFTLNNLSSSAQAVARGVIIILAVLLQQRVATGGFSFRRPGSGSSSGGPALPGSPSGAVSGGTTAAGGPGGARPAATGKTL
ncbi:monosaccharide ABC transporter membrane protein, CUT2 family [Geodermatophilus saharensis]|uniref:Monosaccharide ABC transporter membrane protein, CUT2 family n=1 Tax=Geodermatophilus saharensis TaxID=1137994 RepID=A0A239ELY0_9ACTN|nr:ABC transporter permease [Geodermatophilus saharensis]SNS45043.1 monosaccharide ABC transporter membrane protein, CUT2 family [Geodermatophilus saharensis]